MNTAPRRARTNSGVTIVELMVVMAIISSIMGLGAYMMGAVTGSEIRSDVIKMTAVLKYTYSNACINNTRYRLVMDMGTGTYYTEVTDEPLVTIDEMAESEDFLTEEARELANQRERENDLFDDEEENPFGMNRKVSFQRVQDIIIKQTSLSPGVRFDKFYSPRFPDEPIVEGQASMSFFPNGFQEQVMIVIKDDAGQAFTILTEPMTGRVQLFSEEIDVPDDFGEVESDE